MRARSRLGVFGNVRLTRRLIPALLAAILMLVPLAGEAAIIAVSPSDWTGLRSSADGGLVPGGKWAKATNNGIDVHWQITFDGSLYSYAYTFTGAGSSALDPDPDVSHWILEVSSPSTLDDFLIPDLTLSSDLLNTFFQDNSNPYMPDSIYGIKFEDGPNSGSAYVFQTAREPVWGDLYIKDGKEKGASSEELWTTAWNAGFGTQPDFSTTEFQDWIPRPDGGTSTVPIPSTVLLLAGGMAALAAFRKRGRDEIGRRF